MAVLAGGVLCVGAAQSSATPNPDDLLYRPMPGAETIPGAARAIEDAHELEAFADRVLERQLAESGVPGAVVAIVDHRPSAGPLTFVKGYGFADVASRRGVDPETTLFRLGSISKLFTWIAVMQLVDRGKLDLHADVNDYLQAGRVPPTFRQPITLKHLMTHTAGLEANSYGYMASASANDPTSLADTLARHMPARVRPPAEDFLRGEDALYTNTSAALAGLIVATTSGQGFEQYVDDSLFAPLGMHHSTFHEPIPRALLPGMATGYLPDDDKAGAFRAAPFEFYRRVGPATAASASGADIARFMSANLDPGKSGERRFLSRQSVQLMQSRVFSPHPQVNGAGLGYMETFVNGRRLLWHQGATLQFYSELYLLPAERVGLFVAYNADPPAEYIGELMHEFMDEYFGGEVPDLVAGADAKARAQRYAGTYASVVRSHTTWEKRGWLEVTVDLVASERGLHDVDDPEVHWVELDGAPGVFRQADGEATRAFVTGRDGRLYLLGDDPSAPLVRLALHETPRFDRWLRGWFVLVFGGALLTALKLLVGSSDIHHPRMARHATTALALTGLLILAGEHQASTWNVHGLLIALPWPLLGAMALSLMVPPLALACAVLATRGLLGREWSAMAKAGYGLAAVTGLMLAGWLWFWNLLGFQTA